MGAGPVPEVLHRVLNLLANARARFALPSYTPLAPLFYRVFNLMKFGEHRGGMFIHATGVKDGAKVERSWHLLAEGDDGPDIPSMAIEALIRKMLADETPAIGAPSAMDALELSDYAQLFESRKIFTAFRTAASPDAPLYRHVLGDAFGDLPDQIRALHDDTKPRCWSGTASVKRGQSFLSNLVARLFGFPKAADEVAVTVRLEPFEGGEHSFSSVQSLGKGRNEHLLVERFGPISVALALVVEDEKLFLAPRSWSAFGIPLPRWLLPNGTSFEEEQEGHFHFNVEIAAPIIGRIVAYEGRLSKRS